MNAEERALWDRIVADYLNSSHGKVVFSATVISNADKRAIEHTKLAAEGAVSVGAAIGDVAVAERRKRFTAEPVDGWRGQKFVVTVGQCCYCDAAEVRLYQRGNVWFGCEKCTGLAPQEADAKLP
jgi:uncharacterized protein YegL